MQLHRGRALQRETAVWGVNKAHKQNPQKTQNTRKNKTEMLSEMFAPFLLYAFVCNRNSGFWKWILRVGFWQNGFFADFYFWAAGFFPRIFSPDFISSFLWEKVPRTILQENPRENPPKFIPQKSSDTPSADWPRQGFIFEGGIFGLIWSQS